MKNFLLTAAGIVLFIAIAAGLLILIGYIMHTPSVILTSTECDPPCWYGIHPGLTTSSQVYATLDHLGSVNVETIMEESDGNGKPVHIYWYFQRPSVDGTGSIYFKNDQVGAINILTAGSLNLAALIRKLGQPEKYWTEIGTGENREYVEVILLYPTKGYLAEAVIDINAGANQVEITASTPVFRVTYFAPEMFRELWGTGTLIDPSINTNTGAFQTWSGYGTLSFERRNP
jgi:hypothetical protein